MTRAQMHKLAMRHGEPCRSAKLRKKLRKEEKWEQKHGKPLHGQRAA